MDQSIESGNTDSTSTFEASISGPKPVTVETAIIGAGIAGLYCGYMLGKQQKGFLIAEETSHLGGRIWSTRILENGEEMEDVPMTADKPTHLPGVAQPRLEFCAEFGPMRLELELQEKLKELLDELEFKQEDYEPFPPYESPTSEHDPKYELKGEELEQATPFDLLILAVLRVFGRLLIKGESEATTDGSDTDDQRRSALRKKVDGMLVLLSRATVTRQPTWKEPFIDWIKTLDETDYQNIRQFGVFDDGTKTEDGKPKGTPLWNMGFWNLLSEVLTHHAVMKIRDLGTFYHLIPENPNAAEWLIFWLRGLRTSEAMVGIRGGMQRITEKIVEKTGPSQIKTGHKLSHMTSLSNGEIRLKFKNGAEWHAKRVILALPKAPLEELVKTNEEHFYDDLHKDLEGVFAFPMLKLFLIVKERWWSEDVTRTNRYATLIPTREIHYRRSPLEGSKKGLILLYTDRPASTFWGNYVQPSGAQSEPERGGPEMNPRLINKTLQYLKEYGVRNKDRSDIQFYGIRDWSREPYLGANHTWRPERRSWIILQKLSAFRIGPGKHQGNNANVHICGEAYSDYHGFIEGALRSAAHVLHRIDSEKFLATPTPWLCEKTCDHSSRQNS